MVKQEWLAFWSADDDDPEPYIILCDSEAQAEEAATKMRAGGVPVNTAPAYALVYARPGEPRWRVQ